jgi:hypothetical protein
MANLLGYRLCKPQVGGSSPSASFTHLQLFLEACVGNVNEISAKRSVSRARIHRAWLACIHGADQCKRTKTTIVIRFINPPSIQETRWIAGPPLQAISGF